MNSLTLLEFEIIDIIGAVGAGLIVFGFYRIQIGRWSSKSVWYEFDNLIGASLLGFHEFATGAYISMVVNVLWAFVAINGITSYVDRYEQHHKKRSTKKR